MGTYININTKAIFKSVSDREYMANPDYLEIKTVAKIEAAEAIPQLYRKIVDGNIKQMTASEKLAAESGLLPELKNKKYAEIDNRTNELILNGFTFDNTNFSLSLSAQANWTALITICDTLTFPFTVTTADHNDYILTDIDSLKTIYNAGLNHKNNYISSGRELKKLVTSAKNKTEIDNIIDNRE